MKTNGFDPKSSNQTPKRTANSAAAWLKRYALKTTWGK